jgi:hypothetical protein
MNLEKILAGQNEDEYKPPRYTVRDGAFALQPLPPLSWIVDQLISDGSVNLFYGEPGSKKTYTLLHLAVCVAMGADWLGYKVSPKKVLIIDEESGERRLALRLGMVIRGAFGNDAIPLEFVSLAQFKFDNKDDVSEIKDLIQEHEAGLVVVDALADVMDGDENSKKDTMPTFSNMRKIAETTGCAFVVIHHSNKTGGYRGSSAIKGSLDLMVKMESENGSNWINFKSEKVRDSDDHKFSATATWTEDQFYLTSADYSLTKKRPASDMYVLEFLRRHGESSIDDICESADVCSPGAAKQAIYRLARENLIHRINVSGTGRGHAAEYDLTNKETIECAE